MAAMSGFLTILVLIFLAFACFVIYFIFKQMEFVLTATNLYRKMVTRQDAMIKLLIDIRDGTKQLDSEKIPETFKELFDEEGRQISSQITTKDRMTRVTAGLCPKCGGKVSSTDQNCPFCKINLLFARQHLDEL
jgi:hypothetical protein